MSDHHHKHGQNKPDKKRPAPQGEPASAPRKAGADGNEGEGSRTSARSYNSDLQSFIAKDRVAPAAREAKQFVDQHPEDASKAEQKAAAGPRPILHRLEELASEGRAMFDRTVGRVRARLRRR